MDAFETTLKRAFAEAPEPVGDDFVFAVAGAVARHEKALQTRGVLEGIGMAAGATAVLYGIAQFAIGMAPDLMASAGLELARAHGTLADLGSFNLSAGLTQVLLALGALGGGAVVYRANQQ
jgi:hypothetical protein